MKAFLMFSSSGVTVIVTSYESLDDPEFISQLKARGFYKFVAFELPIKKVKARYGKHFDTIVKDMRDSADLRLLDYSGVRAFDYFSFSEFGVPVYYEPTADSFEPVY